MKHKFQPGDKIETDCGCCTKQGGEILSVNLKDGKLLNYTIRFDDEIGDIAQYDEDELRLVVTIEGFEL